MIIVIRVCDEIVMFPHGFHEINNQQSIHITLLFFSVQAHTLAGAISLWTTTSQVNFLCGVQKLRPLF